jgi:hypothetical protein
MEGGNAFNFIVKIDIVLPPCSPPFVASGSVFTPFQIYLGSTLKMPIAGYTWTKPISSCGAISVVFVSSDSISTSDLILTEASSVWNVEPNDFSEVADYTFTLKVSGVGHGSAAYSESTHGSYEL